MSFPESRFLTALVYHFRFARVNKIVGKQRRELQADRVSEPQGEISIIQRREGNIGWEKSPFHKVARDLGEFSKMWDRKDCLPREVWR